MEFGHQMHHRFYIDNCMAMATYITRNTCKNNTQMPTYKNTHLRRSCMYCLLLSKAAMSFKARYVTCCYSLEIELADGNGWKTIYIFILSKILWPSVKSYNLHSVHSLISTNICLISKGFVVFILVSSNVQVGILCNRGGTRWNTILAISPEL